VEELIAADTVNTMPEATVKAFMHSGNVKVSIEENLPAAKQVVEKLAKEGINIDAVCDKLQSVGVEKFIESFDSLMDSISKNIL
jgi:transaldolase